MPSSGDAAAFLFGGLMIGVWLYFVLFGFPGEPGFAQGSWAFWGFIGLLLAAGIYGARLATPAVRMGILAALGILAGLLATALIVQEDPAGIAALLTLVGGGIVVAGLPIPGEREVQPWPQEQ